MDTIGYSETKDLYISFRLSPEIPYLQQVSINQNILTHQSHMKKRDMASNGVLIVSKESISKTKLIVKLLNQILAIGLSPVHCLRKFLQI